MNVVIYTQDLEPVTVIDLPHWAMEQGEREGVVRLVSRQPLPMSLHKNDAAVIKVHTALIRFNKMRFFGRDGWIVTTDSDAMAMGLEATWLPGQKHEIEEQRQEIKHLTEMLLGELARCRDARSA